MGVESAENKGNEPTENGTYNKPEIIENGKNFC